MGRYFGAHNALFDERTDLCWVVAKLTKHLAGMLACPRHVGSRRPSNRLDRSTRYRARIGCASSNSSTMKP